MIGATKHLDKELEMLHRSVREINDELMEIEADRQYPAQERSRTHLGVHVDSDWAADTVTRKSTSGVIARRGRHLLRNSSTVQNAIGLSSEEIEYYAFTNSRRG